MPRKKKEDIAVDEEKMTTVEEEQTETSAEMDADDEAKESPANEITDAETEDNQAADETAPVEKAVPERRQDVLAEKRKNEKKRAEANIERENKLMSWEQIKSALHEGRTIRSRVIAVESLNDITNVVILMLAGFRVVIPCSEMYANDPLDSKTIASESERMKREKQMLQKLLGAEIPFVITGVEGMPKDGVKDSYAIVASRKKAIQKMAARNFNIHRGEARIKEGDIVEANIVSVGSHALFINVAGIDISLPIFKLTHRYISDCRDEYNTGDVIKVLVSHIDYDDKGHVQNIEVSGKMAEIPQFLKRTHNISSGTRCKGRITSIRPSKKDAQRTVTLLYLEDFELPAIAMYTQIDTIIHPLQTGDTVVFSVYDVRDNGYVRGTIIQRS